MPLPDWIVNGQYDYGEPTLRRFGNLASSGRVPRYNYPDVERFQATVDASFPPGVSWARYLLASQFRYHGRLIDSEFSLDLGYDVDARVFPFGIYTDTVDRNSEWIAAPRYVFEDGQIGGIQGLPVGQTIPVDFQTIDRQAGDALGNSPGGRAVIRYRIGGEWVYVPIATFGDVDELQPHQSIHWSFMQGSEQAISNPDFQVVDPIDWDYVHLLSVPRPLAHWGFQFGGTDRWHTNVPGEIGLFHAPTNQPGPTVAHPLAAEYSRILPAGSVSTFIASWGAPLQSILEVSFWLIIQPIVPIHSPSTVVAAPGLSGVRRRGRIVGSFA